MDVCIQHIFFSKVKDVQNNFIERIFHEGFTMRILKMLLFVLNNVECVFNQTSQKWLTVAMPLLETRVSQERYL